jgi:alkylresorcinol/alkylpyrone synthase
MSDPTPRMAGLTTASPPHNLRQEDVARAGRSLFAGRLSDTDRMFAVYGNAGIDQRQSCVPLSWYLEEHSFSERNELFLTHAVDLMAKATDRSLSLCGLDFGDIDMLVAVST